ncbi:hypothetical protein AB0M46_28410 [Dactylosporangium sp. NPDC051485]|uniref:hypothetical protein n=1 Tax=Dactylosporangium sp. NPDC051485 TaxID=3154846 RepID=UPI003437E55B
MFGRRQVQSHGRLMRDELGESFGHLRMAAAHAADGASGVLAPRVDAARRAMKPRVENGMIRAKGGMDTVMIIAQERTRRGGHKAEKMGRKAKAKAMRKESRSSRRLPMALGGLLVAGAAVGIAGSMLRRRRDQQAWDEYDSTHTTSDTGSKLGAAKSTMDSSIDKARTMGEAAKDRASDLIGHKSTNDGPGGGEFDKSQMPHTASKNGRS